MKKEQKTTLILFVVYLVVLSWIILFKLQFSLLSLEHARNINLIPFSGSVVASGRIDFDEIINNFIVFMPVGIYLGMLKPDWSYFRKIIPIFGISFTYEIVQFIFALGATDITDLIMNTIGGIAGIGVFVLLEKFLKGKTTKILNVIAMVCTLLVIGFIALLLILNG